MKTRGDEFELDREAAVVEAGGRIVLSCVRAADGDPEQI